VTKTLLSLFLAASALALIPLFPACTGDDEESTNDEDDNEARVRYFEDNVLGITVTGVNVKDEYDLADDEVWTAALTVTVRQGEPHSVFIEEDNNPVMSEDNDSDKVTDQTTGNVRIYEADQEFENFIVRDGDNMIVFSINPDDSWVVGGQPAADVDAAAALLIQSPIIKDASLHGLAAIEVLLRYRADEVSSRALCCVGGDGNGCWTSPPPQNATKPILQGLNPEDVDMEEQEDDVVEIITAVIELRLAE
jgi:major membrane immunogen (membrane-anchored lipoprotein)